MDKVTLTFEANEQVLTANSGAYMLASNTVSYIEAVFELGDNWTGYDAVRAVWHTDFQTISTVLDSNNTCIVPAEVLKRKGKVSMNLVGSIVDDGVVTDRLTTYPVLAIVVDAKALVEGTETAEVTASQFEQFVAAVESAVAQIKDIELTTLNADYTLTFTFSDGTSTTVGPIRGETGATGATGNGIASAVLNDDYTLTLTFTDGTSYTTGSIRGATGEDGNGIQSIYKSGESGSVKTYTILFTDGTTFEYDVTDGEVTLSQLLSLLPHDSASGTIATITDGADSLPMDSLVADIEPVQDLNGQDSPYPAGGGVNKLDQSAYTSLEACTYSDGTFTATSDGLSVLSSAMVRLYSNGSAVSTIPKSVTEGARVAITITADSTWDSMFIGYRMGGAYNIGAYFDKGSLADGTYTVSFMADKLPSTTVYGVLSDIQLESGSTATTYAPYSNICPITGWSQVDAVVCGKNLFDDSNSSNGYLDANGAAVTASGWKYTDYIRIAESTTYTFKSGSSAGASPRTIIYDRNKNLLSAIQTGDRTFTTDSGAFYIRISYRTTDTNIQLETGSTATTYEAYTGTTYTTQLGSTYYGGTLDMVSGVLTVDRCFYSGINWTQYNTSNGYIAYSTTSLPMSNVANATKFADSEFVSNMISEVGSFSSSSMDRNIVQVPYTGQATAYMALKSGVDPTTVEVSYKIATPTTIQLTAQEIDTLKGNNSIFATTGDVEVGYVCDVKLYIDKIVNA